MARRSTLTWWKTQGLKQALDLHGFGRRVRRRAARRGKIARKERIFSFRSSQHRWTRSSSGRALESYNARKHKGESIRVFPISNWTELDICSTSTSRTIPIVPLYFAASGGGRARRLADQWSTMPACR